MNKAIKWVLDGPIEEDAGDVGGDHQVGPAISARFRSDEQPDARFEVTMYATAKEYTSDDEDDPACPHPRVIAERLGDNVVRYESMPADHIACSFKPGTVDVEAQYIYRRNGRIEYGTYESDDSDDITYNWEGSDVGYGADKGMPEEIRLATEDAKAKVRDYVENIDEYLHWDGVSAVKY